MRISDWSSDVCSSDLFSHHARAFTHGADTDGAVLADFDFLLWRYGDRTTVAHYRHTVAGPQHAQGVNVEAAGAHIAFTAFRILHSHPDRKSTRLNSSH